MIDFSTLQGLTIPEGVVTKITDASGRVLWSAAKKKVVVTITDPPIMFTQHDQQYANVKINGVVYDGSEVGEEIQVEVGTTIECYVYATSENGLIAVNNETKLSGTSGTYIHTVTSNCQIRLGYFVIMRQYDGRIIIEET